MKVAIVTDSNSGISQKMAKELGVFIVPMPFYINEEVFYEGTTLSQAEFYEKLKSDADIKTSMPSPTDVTDLWDELLKEYDSVVHIPMSSGLSGSCQTAIMLSEDYGDKVLVVDNKRISLTQYQAALEALALAESGKSAAEIKEILEAHAHHSTIYITLETLKYLKKGGRITPAAAAIGTLLNIKPILTIQGDKLDAYSKCRGKAQAKKAMLGAVKNDLETRFKENYSADRFHLGIAYSDNIEEANEWKKEIMEAFPGHDVTVHPMSLSVATHIGGGALAITCTEYLPSTLLSDDIQNNL